MSEDDDFRSGLMMLTGAFLFGFLCGAWVMI